MIKIDGLNLPLDYNEPELIKELVKLLGEKPESWKLYKKAIDARRKNNVHFVCSVLAEVKNEDRVLSMKPSLKRFTDESFNYPGLKKEAGVRPVVIGTGPAGTFAALCLAHAGARPIIIERGKEVDKRTRDVDLFFSGGSLNENSNVQFGEGGAGTFSDGKLNTGVNNPYIRKILEEYVRFGAPEDILTDAKPHIGTDVLKKIAVNIRHEVESLGGTYLFEKQFDDFSIKNGKITSVSLGGEKIETSYVILAIGHSARDTFRMLKEKGVCLEQKPFSVGVRIEHPQELINRLQYGKFANHPALPNADYKFGDDCYTFCMCPGGFVVASSSEEKTIVTNGMSYSSRDGANANSALLVNVNSDDFGDGIFDGMKFQQKIEQKAYQITGGYNAPCQKLSDFIKGFKSSGFGSVLPTYKPGVSLSDMNTLLPYRVCENLKSGIDGIDRKMKGFLYEDALLTGPETRSSSPVRIVRTKETYEAIGIEGLFPAGEGAGYAGGIMSAASDGIRCAAEVIRQMNERSLL